MRGRAAGVEGAVLFECVHLCLRVLDRHVFAADGDVLWPFPAQARVSLSRKSRKTGLHMQPSIHPNLPPIQPDLAVLLRPAAPPPRHLSSSSLQPAAGLETD